MKSRNSQYIEHLSNKNLVLTEAVINAIKTTMLQLLNNKCNKQTNNKIFYLYLNNNKYNKQENNSTDNL